MSAQALKLGCAIGFALIAAMAWSAYQTPAMALMLASFRFCG